MPTLLLTGAQMFLRLLLAPQLRLRIAHLSLRARSEGLTEVLGCYPVEGPLVAPPPSNPWPPAVFDGVRESHRLTWKLNVDPYDPDVPSGRNATDAALEVSVEVPVDVSDADALRNPAQIRLVIDGETVASRHARSAAAALIWMAAADDVYCRNPRLAFGWRAPRTC